MRYRVFVLVGLVGCRPSSEPEPEPEPADPKEPGIEVHNPQPSDTAQAAPSEMGSNRYAVRGPADGPARPAAELPNAGIDLPARFPKGLAAAIEQGVEGLDFAPCVDPHSFAVEAKADLEVSQGGRLVLTSDDPIGQCFSRLVETEVELADLAEASVPPVEVTLWYGVGLARAMRNSNAPTHVTRPNPFGGDLEIEPWPGLDDSVRDTAIPRLPEPSPEPTPGEGVVDLGAGAKKPGP